MPWERRKRGGLYYTRSRRVNGRVVRTYFGSGREAKEAHREDLQRREAVRHKAEACRQERLQLEEGDRGQQSLNEMVNRLTHAVMHAAGYHLHHRGEWRRRSGG